MAPPPPAVLTTGMDCGTSGSTADATELEQKPRPLTENGKNPLSWYCRSAHVWDEDTHRVEGFIPACAEARVHRLKSPHHGRHHRRHHHHKHHHHRPRRSRSRSSSCSSSEECERTSVSVGRALRFRTTVSNLPHAEKTQTGGEDAWFISKDGCSIGVADGVGGWVRLNIDAGEYARSLMRLTQEEAETAGPYAAPTAVLQAAFNRMPSDLMGSCTASVLSMSEDGLLRAAVLGDSQFVVIRDDEVVYRSPTTMHYFNCPRQLGATSNDRPSDAATASFRARPGDYVVLGSDGVFDNLFDEEIIAILREARRLRLGHEPATALAAVRTEAAALANAAQIASWDTTRDSPFSVAAREAGHRYFGGKQDDVTVIVAHVDFAACSDDVV